MSYVLSAIKQVRWPEREGPYGFSTLIINRPGTTDMNIAASDTLLISLGDPFYPSPYLLSGFPLSKKNTTTKGRRALDDLTITMRDSLRYAGLVNSVTTKEDLEATYQTFFDVFFSDTAQYKTFVLWTDKATNTTEVQFEGFIEPAYKPGKNPHVYNPGTLQQIFLGDRTLKIIDGGNALNKTFQAVLDKIGSSDCQSGTPYNGFMYAPPGASGKVNSRAAAFSSDKGGWYHAVPHVHKYDGGSNPLLVRLPDPLWPDTPWTQNATNGIGQLYWLLNTPINLASHGYNVGDTGTIDGPGLAAKYVIRGATGDGAVVMTFPGSGFIAGSVYTTTVTTGGGDGTLEILVNSVNAKSGWGPSGLVFISIGNLFAKIAEALEFETPFVPSTDLKSALSWWAQKAGTNLDFPIDTSAEIALDNLWLNLNVFAKSHPADGSFWDNPVGWSPTTPINDVLNGLCNLLLCDFNLAHASDGTSAIALRAMGGNTDALPASWEVIGDPSQEEPSTGPRSVKVKYRADDLKVQSPFGMPGDSTEIEVPARLHRIARTSHEISGENWDKEAAIYDAGKKYDEQSDECFKVVWINENGQQIPNPECWKGLCYIYWFNASNTNVVYPSSWSPFPKNDGSAGDWSNSFYVVNAIFKAGETPPADLMAEFAGNDYFNLRCYHAVAFATLSLALPMVQVFQYSGVSDDTGSVQNIGAGIYGQWLLAGNVQDWRAIELNQEPVDGTTTAKWQAVANSGAFPHLTDLAYGYVGSSGTSGGTGGGSGMGGGIDQSSQLNQWHILTPAQLTTNTNNWAPGQTHGVTVIYINSSADITLTGLTGGAANDLVILVNNGAHAITLLNDNAASTAANRFLFAGQSGLLGLGPRGKAGLLYDTTAARWRVIFQ